jgi:hypothetical protein
MMKDNKIPKRRFDGMLSIDRHQMAGLILQKLAPNHIGKTYSRTKGEWMNVPKEMQERDTPLGRSNTPIEEKLRPGYDANADCYKNGDALRGISPEIVPYMARFHKKKGKHFVINSPRKGDLTIEQAPLGLAPFPEEAMHNREMEELLILTYLNCIGGPFLVIDMVGPSLEEVEWIWVRRLWAIPLECYKIYSVKGQKRNRILIIGHKTYVHINSPYHSWTNNSEPEQAIIDALFAKDQYEYKNLIFIPKQKDEYDN